MELTTRLKGLTGNVEQDLKTLHNYVLAQSEELRYLLHNLDVTNFNDLGLARYENGRLQIYSEQVKIATTELRIAIEDEIEGLGDWVTEVEATANGLQTTVKGHTSSINSLNTKATNLQSQITQNSNSISLVVSGGNVNAASIVTAINNSASTVKISADHVNISGFVTVEDLKGEGKTEINGSNITSGTISGVTLESVGSRGYQTISIANGVIDFYSGSIYDADYGVLGISASQLQLTGNAWIRMEGTNGIYFHVGRSGRYWLLDGTGMNYYDEDGNYINGFQFAN